MKINHKGFTVLEAIASVFIVSLVLTTAISMIVAMRSQAQATEDKRDAVEIGTLIRNDIERNYTYQSLIALVAESDLIITDENCGTSLYPLSCDLFNLSLNDKTYDENITIIIKQSTADSIRFKLIHFEIHINYYARRTLILEGVIYD